MLVLSLRLRLQASKEAYIFLSLGGSPVGMLLLPRVSPCLWRAALHVSGPVSQYPGRYLPAELFKLILKICSPCAGWILLANAMLEGLLDSFSQMGVLVLGLSLRALWRCRQT